MPNSSDEDDFERDRRDRDRPRNSSRNRDDHDDDRDDYDDRGDRRRPRRRDGQPEKSSSSTKVVLIVVAVVGVLSLIVIGVLVALLLPAVQKVRSAASRLQSQNNMRLMALAAANYESEFRSLPTPFLSNDSGKPVTYPKIPSDRLSWRVGILPFAEQADLYRRIKLDESWNSPANMPITDSPLKTFCRPGEPETSATPYRCFYDNGAVFSSDPTVKMNTGQINDGASNTILFVDATDTVPWAQFNEFKFDPNQPLPPLGNKAEETFNVAFADGSVRFFRKNTSPASIRSAIMTNDGGVGILE